MTHGPSARLAFLILAIAPLLTLGCGTGEHPRPPAQSPPPNPLGAPGPEPTSSIAPSPTIPPPPLRARSTAPAAATPTTAAIFRLPIRINAGCPTPYTDPAGVTWSPDLGQESGFIGGRTVDRGPIPIANTKSPDLYRTEHFLIERIDLPVPDGRYTVRLHFAETYDRITAPGQRIFSIRIDGIAPADAPALQNIDIFKQAGGPRKALVKTARVITTGGHLRIAFLRTDKNNPEINALEVLPDRR
jgi:hypothetical protein